MYFFLFLPHSIHLCLSHDHQPFLPSTLLSYFSSLLLIIRITRTVLLSPKKVPTVVHVSLHKLQWWANVHLVILVNNHDWCVAMPRDSPSLPLTISKVQTPIQYHIHTKNWPIENDVKRCDRLSNPHLWSFIFVYLWIPPFNYFSLDSSYVTLSYLSFFHVSLYLYLYFSGSTSCLFLTMNFLSLPPLMHFLISSSLHRFISTMIIIQTARNDWTLPSLSTMLPTRVSSMHMNPKVTNIP